MSQVETYAKWELEAEIKGVRLSALSVTEQHKNKVLTTWKRMKATNITVKEREAPALPVWQVEIRARNYDLLRFEIVASSKERVEEVMAKKKEFKPWQLLSMKISLVERHEETGL